MYVHMALYVFILLFMLRLHIRMDVNTYVHIKLLEFKYHRMIQNEITYKNVILYYLMNFVLIPWIYICAYIMYVFIHTDV